jgi:hypothetical protein
MTFASPPTQLDPAILRDARPLNLCLVPASSAALSLVQDITISVEKQQAPERKTARRAVGQAKLKGVVGAIVGALLTAWGGHRTPLPTYRSRKKDGFTAAPVGFNM